MNFFLASFSFERSVERARLRQHRLLLYLLAAEQAGKQADRLGSGLHRGLAAQLAVVAGLDDFHRHQPRDLGLAGGFGRGGDLLAALFLGADLGKALFLGGLDLGFGSSRRSSAALARAIWRSSAAFSRAILRSSANLRADLALLGALPFGSSWPRLSASIFSRSTLAAASCFSFSTLAAASFFSRSAFGGGELLVLLGLRLGGKLRLLVGLGLRGGGQLRPSRPSPWRASPSRPWLSPTCPSRPSWPLPAWSCPSCPWRRSSTSPWRRRRPSSFSSAPLPRPWWRSCTTADASGTGDAGTGCAAKADTFKARLAPKPRRRRLRNCMLTIPNMMRPNRTCGGRRPTLPHEAESAAGRFIRH